jgi:hypothetical protein
MKSVLRFAAVVEVATGAACWGRPTLGMAIYGGGVALFLAYVGLGRHMAGILLWPAVVLHVVLTALLIRTTRRRTQPDQSS